MRTLSLYGALLATLLAGWGCDSTVGLDPTRTSFSKLIVPGACEVAGDLSEVDISVLLLDGRSAIMPDDRLQRQTLNVGALLTLKDFSFAQIAETPVGIGDVAFFSTQVEGQPKKGGVDLNNLAIDYLYPGGEARKDDERLVVLLLDQSGSLKGIDPISNDLDIEKASDYNGQHFDFFNMLVSAMPADDYISLMWFKDRLPTVHAEYSVPSLNRDVLSQGIAEIRPEISGFTPLADALSDALTKVIDQNDDLNPVVILFTDGTGAGDTSQSGKTLAQATDEYVNHTGGAVPVIVLHLQPSVLSDHTRGRDPELVDLACRTGGEYIFIESPDEFTASDVLQDIVRNRVAGVWRLRVQAAFNYTVNGAPAPLPDGEYLLSTELRVNLGGRDRPYRMGLSNDGFDYNDSRLWFLK